MSKPTVKLDGVPMDVESLHWDASTPLEDKRLQSPYAIVFDTNAYGMFFEDPEKPGEIARRKVPFTRCEVNWPEGIEEGKK